MILNQNIDFIDLPRFVQDAFQQKFGRPSKDLLPAGMKIYKFNDGAYLTKFNSKTELSEWWSPYHSYKHDAGWQQKVNIARANGISVREWGRLTSAVKENWNSLSYILEITLKSPVYGFFGGFSQMARIDPGSISKRGAGEGSGSKNLPGGATQFYIPNLTIDYVASHNFTKLS